MFSSPEPNLIQSDEGFSVEVLGRTGILYCEGDHIAFVDSELLASGGSAGIAIWRNRIKAWRHPYEDEKIDPAKREQIIDNIRRAISFAGDDIEVIG